MALWTQPPRFRILLGALAGDLLALGVIHNRKLEQSVPRQLSLGLVGIFIPLARLQSQVRPSVAWPSTGSWVSTQAPRCGEVRGRVVQWPSGYQGDSVPAPLSNAFVQIIDSMDQSVPASTHAAVSTDAAGEFTLRIGTTAPAATLVVKFVGYEPAVVALDASKRKAWAVEIGMRPAGMHDPQSGLTIYAVRSFSSCAP